MSVRNNLSELKDWLSYRKRESTISAKIVRKHLKKEKERLEYFKFKKVLFEKIDELLYSGENSKMVIRPVEGTEYLYELLVQDDEFNNYYDWRFTRTGELEVSMKSLF